MVTALCVWVAMCHLEFYLPFFSTDTDAVIVPMKYCDHKTLIPGIVSLIYYKEVTQNSIHGKETLLSYTFKEYFSIHNVLNYCLIAIILIILLIIIVIILCLLQFDSEV
jgi:hypothetical protein